MAVNGRVTAQLLKQKSGEFDVESIFILDLRQQDIDDLGNIGECMMLDKLNLSRNRIQKLYALSSLMSLTWLDLSANMIQYVDGLQTLEKLKYLNLAGNLIQNVESLNCLFGLESLTSLRLRDTVLDLANPVCASCTYKHDIQQNLPTLRELDGERLLGKGKEVFELLNSVSQSVNSSRLKSASSAPRESPLTSLPDDYFSAEENYFQDDVDTLDAEMELRQMLTECRKMYQSETPQNAT